MGYFSKSNYIYNKKQQVVDFTKEFLNNYPEPLYYLDWYNISRKRLSEEFIVKYDKYLDWYKVSKFSQFSEQLIRRFKNKVDWPHIVEYQKLSNKFRKEFKLAKPEISWINNSVSNKLRYIKKYKIDKVYKMGHDKSGHYLIAYKTVICSVFNNVKKEYFSLYDSSYEYHIGEEHESHCDCAMNIENSFGLSAWTKRGAIDYYRNGTLFLVKIYLKDLGAIVHDGTKLRAFKLTVLKELSNNKG
jgi:hypothetical protein